MLTIDSISFDLTGWKLKQNKGNTREWVNGSGDNRTMIFYPKPDPPPFDQNHIHAIRNFHRQMLAQEGGGLIEATLIKRPELSVLLVISKFPQQDIPAGFVFMGGVSSYVRGSGFTINAQYHEGSTTGVRESAVALATGMDTKPGFFSRLKSSFSGETMDKWLQDPYDPSFRGPVMRCLADDARWDGEFPEHPLSRLRMDTKKLINSLTIKS